MLFILQVSILSEQMIVARQGEEEEWWWVLDMGGW